MKYAWVTTNLLDMWVEPQFESERCSQLFFGEVVRIEKEEEGFCRVRQDDGYSGWADNRFLNEISESSYQQHLDNINATVTAPTATIVDPQTHQPVAPFLLYYGTRLRAQPYGENFQKLLLATGDSFLIKTRAIRPINSESSAVTGLKLVNEARRFLGVPYLWGGVTVTGFDCSGLVRTVFSRFGIYLPRDTKDQISTGQQVERERIKSGDLLFFKRHVGLALGRTHIVHASRGGGGVRINSLVSGQPDYREDLDRDFAQARRMTT